MRKKFIKSIDRTYIDNLDIKINNINQTRIKIDTGMYCNEKCTYCYYLDKLDDPHLDKQLILDQIDKAKKFGFTEIEFSGGESSVHPNFIDFIKYGTKLGLRCSTLSNGTMSEKLLRSANKAGLMEVMYSIHGYKQGHDKVTKLDGSYELIIKQLKTCHKLEMVQRINIVVHKGSIHELNNILLEIQTLEELFELEITQYNFLPINEWNNASKIAKYQQPYLKNNYVDLEHALFYLESKDKDFNIRYLEYCKIDERYHKYIVNHLDHYYDVWDWNPLFIHKEDILNREEYLPNSKEIKDKLKAQRSTQYFKTRECIECKHMRYCDGFKN